MFIITLFPLYNIKLTSLKFNHFIEGGDLGNREEAISTLVARMN